MCDQKSVFISPPPSFRQITYYILQNNSQSEFVFDNFTTNYPIDCPVVSHSLAVSSSNFTSPKEFSLIEGRNHFKIYHYYKSQNPQLYDFYIIARAQGGSMFSKKIFIKTLKDYDFTSL